MKFASSYEVVSHKTNGTDLKHLASTKWRGLEGHFETTILVDTLLNVKSTLITDSAFKART
jgi:hypothetical protein